MLFFDFSRPAFRFSLVPVVALTLLLVAACSPDGGDSESASGADDFALVWEAWDALHANYAAPDTLDEDALVGGAIGRIMELGEIDPYPFLTDLGRMRGQIPSGVPAELTDLWRASQVYRQDNPDAEPDEVTRILVQGMMDELPGSASIFLTAEQLPEAREQLERELEGSYLGIGARVVAQEGRILLFPFSDSPAEKAGIQQGDALMAVNGVSVGNAHPR